MKTDMFELDGKRIPVVYLPIYGVPTLFDDCEHTFVVNGFKHYIRCVFVDEVPGIIFALSSNRLSPYNHDIKLLAYKYDRLAADCMYDRYLNKWEKSAPIVRRLRKGFAKRVLNLVNHD